MNKKLLCILLIFASKANCMELISPTIQDRVITPAIVLGIGAASGAAQAMIFNHINKKNNIDDRCSILNSAAAGMIYTLPIVVIHELYLLDNNKIINQVIKTETLKNIFLPTLYSSYVKKYRSDKDSFHNDFFNMQGNSDTATSLATFNGPPSVHHFTAKTKMTSEFTRSWGNKVFALWYGLLASAAIFSYFNDGEIKPRSPYQTGA